MDDGSRLGDEISELGARHLWFAHLHHAPGRPLFQPTQLRIDADFMRASDRISRRQFQRFENGSLAGSMGCTVQAPGVCQAKLWPSRD